MCGRYAASRNPDDLVEEVSAAGLPLAPLAAADREALHPSFNVAPTQDVAVVLAPRPPAGAGAAAGADGKDATEDGPAVPAARLRPMRWGLVPSWAKDPKVGNRMINARVETVGEKPAFRSLVASRRCLLPADGWFEWQTVPADRSPTGKARKQPFFMAPPGGGLVGLAGLYSWWRDRDVADDEDPAAWLGTVTVLTTDAEPALQAVHDRMPVVLPPEHWQEWVSRDVPGDEALALLRSLPEGRFAAVPVQAAVGNVRNDSPALLQRPDDAELAGVVDPTTGQLFG
ncbi:SOS response-associated peptidase [Aquipuribacter hungaricus]|uniref:Abasic site processing protein n=1 Tax=Aquipuribacter hungaricus TaxID=545624 RepID=A0ABV7WNE2_9MICO